MRNSGRGVADRESVERADGAHPSLNQSHRSFHMGLEASRSNREKRKEKALLL